VATAPTLVLDPTGLNINLNAQGSSTGIFLQGESPNNPVVSTGVDWGNQAIQDVFNTGQYRLEDVDALLAANQVVRIVVCPIRVVGSSADNLNTTLSNLNFALAKASRFQTLDLTFTPAGSTKVTTLKVIGGDLQAPYQQITSNNFRWIGQLTLFCLPFGYGAKQTYGTSGAPLLAATAGPVAFTVTIPAGSEGDVLADVTVIFQLTVDSAGAVALGCISGNSSWTVASDVTGWTNGSGAGTRSTPANAKYKGAAAKGYVVSSVNAIEEAFTQTFTTSDFPTGTPIRILLVADDTQVVLAQRGLCQTRVAVTAGGVTAYGDWVSVPASAGNGTTTHFSQALDMGVFTFPPGPSGSVAFSGNTTISLQQQDGNTGANKLAMVYDEVIFLPDASSLIAEWPVIAGQPAANTPIRVESDLLFNNADGAPQSVLLSGAHIRSRGTTRYTIWASDQAMANTTSDVTYSTVKAWVEVVPRYVALAPI
jgi:hypothetical protein